MANSSHSTMLREFSAAGEGGRTGALDVEWEGARASFFFEVGQPTHLTFDAADGRRLDGLLALDALVDELPAVFEVAPWRRDAAGEATLHCSADELRTLFERNGAGSNGRSATSNGHSAAAAPQAPEWLRVPPPDGEQPPFGLYDFPRLELGPPLWSVPIAKLINFELIVSHLRDTLLVLSGPSCRAAAVVRDGEIAKAVLVSVTARVLGEAAAQALLIAPRGTLAAHRLDDPLVIAAMALLWPDPPAEDIADPEPEVIPEPDVTPATTAESAQDTDTAVDAELEPAPPEAASITDELISEPATGDVAMFTLPAPDEPAAPEEDEILLFEADRAAEFVAPRIEVDIDALRIELTEIAVRWLGDDASVPVAGAIAATRPGVDDFVATIGAIGTMDVSGHESAIVRAMSREMHYRAAEVLCGV